MRRRAGNPSDCTGFGLAIAKQLAERHGGTIRVESSDGGTRFTITLSC